MSEAGTEASMSIQARTSDEDDVPYGGPQAAAAAASSEVSGRMTLRQEIEAYFQQLRDPLFRYLRACGASEAEAGEVTRETFVRLYRRLNGGSPTNQQFHCFSHKIISIGRFRR